MEVKRFIVESEASQSVPDQLKSLGQAEQWTRSLHVAQHSS